MMMDDEREPIATDVLQDSPADTPAVNLDDSGDDEDSTMRAIYRDMGGAEDGEDTQDAESAGDETSGFERDPATGRFVAKQAARQEGDTEAEPQLSPDQGDQPQNAQEITEGHFRGWSPEDREAFSKLQPEAQQFVLGRQKAMQGAWTQQSQEWSEYQQAAEPYLDVIRNNAEYFERLAASGLEVTPDQAIGGLLETEATLRFGSWQEKVATIQALARDYGVPVDVMSADPLVEDPMQPGGDAYPVVHDLRQQIASLEAKLGQFQTQSQTIEQQRHAADVQSFATAKNEDGSPRHPYFDLVRHHMAHLYESGQVASLDQAYAIAAKPIIEATQGNAALKERAQQEAAAKARDARRLNVVSAPTGQDEYGSEDDMLRAVYRQAINA